MPEYSLQRYRPLLVIQGSDTTVTMSLTDLATGDVVSLSTVTYALYNASNEEVQSGSASIADNTASVNILGSSTSSQTRGTRWRMEWTADGVVYREEAALVTADLHCPITESDLYAEEPILRHIAHADDTLTAIPWAKHIEATYRHFYGRLLSVQRWPWLVMSPYSFRSYLIYDCLDRVFRSLGKGSFSSYRQEANEYASKAREEWDRLHFSYDANDDGKVSTSETGRSAQPVIYVGSGPRGSYASYGRRY